MTKKTLIPFLILLASGGLLWAYLQNSSLLTEQNGVSLEKNPEKHSNLKPQKHIFSVKSHKSQWKSIEIFQDYAGITSPLRQTNVEAEISGRIQKIHIKEGMRVSQGQLLFTLSDDGRYQKLKAAEAAVKLRKMQYAAAQKLEEKKFTSPISLASAAYNLQKAKLGLDIAQTDYKRTRISAPFSGIVQKIYVDPNKTLSASLMDIKLCHLMELSPLYVSIEISEAQYEDTKNITEAIVRLPNGKEQKAYGNFVSSLAKKKTKTFSLRFELLNENYAIPSGLSVDVKVPKAFYQVHEINPSWTVLSSSGETGIMVIRASKAHFMPFKIAHSSKDKFYAQGLPQNIEIITRGQNEVLTGTEIRTT